MPAAAPSTQRVCPQCAADVSWPDYADVVVCSSCGSTLAADATLRAVQCPQCAGPLAAVGGLRMLACCHCGVHVLVSTRGGHDRWRLPLRASRGDAERIAWQWLRDRSDAATPSDGATFGKVALIYAPIWEYGALVAGWEFGFHTRVRCESVRDDEDERLELRPYREEVQEGRLQERRFYQAGADLAAVGATRPRITGREPLLPVIGGDLDGALVLPAQGSATDILAAGRRRVLSPTSRAERPQARLDVVRESASLLFYPLWVLELREGARRYSFVVNGFEGTMNSARVPAGELARLRKRAATVAPLAVAAALFVVLALVSSNSRIPALILALMVLAGAVAVFLRTRERAEVEYHDPYSS